MTRQTHAQELVAWVADQLGHEVPNASDAVRRIAEVPDEAVRVQMAELLVCAERAERDAGSVSSMRKEHYRRDGVEREEREWLEAMCESAMTGAFGPQVRDAAIGVLCDEYGQRRTDIESMRAAHTIIQSEWEKTGKRRYDVTASRGRRAAD